MRGLKDRIRAGERLIGTLLRMPAEELLEMTAVAGFDFVIVDGEHGPLDLLALRHHVALAQVHGMAVLVRTGESEPATVLRALDAGADGVLAPHIDTVEQARALVDSAHYPPLGHRGFATYGRSGAYGRVDPSDHRAAAADTTVVLGMIESPLGVRLAADIFTVPGFDGTMVGVADLRASSTPDDLDPGEAIRQVHAAAADAGRARMDIVNDPSQAQASFTDGAQLVVYNLTATVMDHLAALRGVLPMPTITP